MKLTIEDKGNFLRSFLVLIRMDRMIEKDEKKMALIIGKYFGFSETFCKKAIDELLENENLSEDPPIFSNREIAELFIMETRRILTQIHGHKDDEIEWLKKTAILNGIEFNK